MREGREDPTNRSNRRARIGTNSYEQCFDNRFNINTFWNATLPWCWCKTYHDVVLVAAANVRREYKAGSAPVCTLETVNTGFSGY